MADFALGMGSNLGNRMENLLEGVRFIMSRSSMGRESSASAAADAELSQRSQAGYSGA